MPYVPPAQYPYENDSSPGAADGDIVYAEIPNHIMAYLQDELPIDIAAGAGATPDHGTLTGLTDDDHTQYALADGTRGNFEPTGTTATHIADTTDAHDASAISVDASGFSTNLSGTDTNVQTALETIDALALGSATVDFISNVATQVIIGRNTAGSGNSEELSPTTARTVLGLGNSATRNVGTTAGTVLAGDTTIPTQYTDTLAKNAVKRVIQIAVTDPNGAALTTGDGKAFAFITSELNGQDLTAVSAAVTTVSSSGAVTVQVARVRSGTPVDMLSTALTIDASEASSATAATAAVINTSNDDIATNDFIRIDIDGAGTGTKGLIVTLTFTTP